VLEFAENGYNVLSNIHKNKMKKNPPDTNNWQSGSSIYPVLGKFNINKNENIHHQIMASGVSK